MTRPPFIPYLSICYTTLMDFLHEQLDQVQSPSTPIPRMVDDNHSIYRPDSPPTPEPTTISIQTNRPGSALTAEQPTVNAERHQ